MSPILVTKPFLPDINVYQKYLEQIWERNWLTNQGPLVQELENSLGTYLGVNQPVICVANGGLGLQIILRAMGVRGEVITTPFSYVATSSCPLWEHCSLKFADIEHQTLTIDPVSVESLISTKTEAIIATHVYGNPCDVEALESIAAKHGLALIYDAAHAFGVKYKGKNILHWGDANMVSTHATKIFHTIEGGFLLAKDNAVLAKMEWMRRFGHNGPAAFHGVAMNAKMSEMHAAMGLSILPQMNQIIEERKKIWGWYLEALCEQPNIIPGFTMRSGTEWNGAYGVVRVKGPTMVSDIVSKMEESRIGVRRYFHPLLSECGLTEVGQEQTPVAKDASESVLCLPLYCGLSRQDVEKVCEILVNIQK